MKKLLAMLLSLALSLSLLCPAWAAAASPILKIEDGTLTLEGLGDQSLNSVQLELTMRGTGTVRFDPASGSKDSYSFGKTDGNKITIYIDSPQSLNQSGAAFLGTLDLGGNEVTQARLTLLDHDLNPSEFPSIQVRNVSSGSPGGNNGSGDGSSLTGTGSTAAPEANSGTAAVTANSTTSGTTANAAVSSSDMDRAVDSAVAEATKQGAAPVVEIEVKISARADSLNVTLPASSLERLAETKGSSLVVTSDVAEVALDHSALTALVNQAAGSTIILAFAPVSVSTLTAAQKAAVGNAAVVELSLVSGGTTIHDYSTGVITVSLPYTLPSGKSASDVVVYYLDNDGSLASCSTRYANGKVTFTTTHLGKYVIGDRDMTTQKTATSFTDVPSSAYYADAVAWAVANGITTGATSTTFSPNESCTRAQIVTFLWRAAGSPKMNGANPFMDVAEGEYYFDAVLWAVANGITTGATSTTFNPSAPCTRAQAVSFLYRAKNSPTVNGTNSFTDLVPGAYYTNAVQWAVNAGVTTGTTATTFGPDQNCTRAQIVSFLYRDRVN